MSSFSFFPVFTTKSSLKSNFFLPVNKPERMYGGTQGRWCLTAGSRLEFKLYFSFLDASDSFDSYLHILAMYAHLHAQLHADHSHACIRCQVLQTVANPPPLEQKDLFLSCYRETGRHTHSSISCVFSRDQEHYSTHHRSPQTYMVGLWKKNANNLNMLIETVEQAATFYVLHLESVSSLSAHPGVLVIWK